MKLPENLEPAREETRQQWAERYARRILGRPPNESEIQNLGKFAWDPGFEAGFNAGLAFADNELMGCVNYYSLGPDNGKARMTRERWQKVRNG